MERRTGALQTISIYKAKNLLRERDSRRKNNS